MGLSFEEQVTAANGEASLPSLRHDVRAASDRQRPGPCPNGVRARASLPSGRGRTAPRQAKALPPREEAAMNDDRECPVSGCETRHPPHLMMCRSHWFQVPKHLRDEVWDAYRNDGVLSVRYWD